MCSMSSCPDGYVKENPMDLGNISSGMSGYLYIYWQMFPCFIRGWVYTTLCTQWPSSVLFCFFLPSSTDQICNMNMEAGKRAHEISYSHIGFRPSSYVKTHQISAGASVVCRQIGYALARRLANLFFFFFLKWCWWILMIQNRTCQSVHPWC